VLYFDIFTLFLEFVAFILVGNHSGDIALWLRGTCSLKSLNWDQNVSPWDETPHFL